MVEVDEPINDYSDQFPDAYNAQSEDLQKNTNPSFKYPDYLKYGVYKWQILAKNRIQKVVSDKANFVVLKLGASNITQDKDSYEINDKPFLSWSKPMINNNECEEIDGEEFTYTLYINGNKAYSGNEKEFEYKAPLKKGSYSWFVEVSCQNQKVKSQVSEFTVE